RPPGCTPRAGPTGGSWLDPAVAMAAPACMCASTEGSRGGETITAGTCGSERPPIHQRGISVAQSIGITASDVLLPPYETPTTGTAADRIASRTEPASSVSRDRKSVV